MHYHPQAVWADKKITLFELSPSDAASTVTCALQDLEISARFFCLLRWSLVTDVILMVRVCRCSKALYGIRRKETNTKEKG